MNSLYPLFRKFVFLFDAELVHHLTLKMLYYANKLGLIKRKNIKQNPETVMGITFPNKVGLAAGLDKNAICIDAFSKLGFGHIEVGTVTPRPQIGNPTPRLFRLPKDKAIINRMGFNNCGIDKLIENISKQKCDCILGINIGKNKDTPEEKTIEDYLICFRKAYPFADYIAINVSSPNTPGLREFGQSGHLAELIKTLIEERELLKDRYKKHVPLAVKISPDISIEQMKAFCDTLIEFKVEAIIATNTTVSRENLTEEQTAKEIGGLSGEPLTNISTELINEINKHVNKNIDIIGVGGIHSKQTALDKINAGSKLVQIYTGFIYEGPGLVNDIANLK